MLVVRTPGQGAITLLPAQGLAVRDALEDSDRTHWHAAGMVAFPLQALPAAAQPLWLHFEPTHALSGTLTLQLSDAPAFQRTQLRWVAYVSAALAILLGMALTALCFAVLLRDSVYLIYAGYVGSYALLQVLSTGYLFHPLGWELGRSRSACARPRCRRGVGCVQRAVCLAAARPAAAPAAVGAAGSAGGRAVPADRGLQRTAMTFIAAVRTRLFCSPGR